MIDIPKDALLADVKCNEKLKRLLEENKSTGIEVIVHFTPENVFNTEQYQQLVQTISAKRQLVVNDRNK